MKSQTAKKTTVRIGIRWTVFFLILLISVAFFAGFLPVSPVVVATGSMEPNINIGDIAVVLQCDSDKLDMGDIIQYNGNNCTVIHRIVDKSGDAYITKGDANNSPDLMPVKKSQVIGKVVCTLPKVGLPTLWLHEKTRSIIGF